MATKRVTIGLGLGALVALAGLLFLAMDDSADRASRTKSAPDAAHERARQGSAGLGDTDSAGVADERQLADLIKKYGGFASAGRVLLTRPEAPGSGLEIKLHGSVDGLIVEREVATDATGRFSLAEVPRVPGYVLSVESARTQPLRVDLETPESEDRLDLGDLTVDRYYFVSGKVVEGSHPVKEVAVALVAAGGGSGFNFRSMAEAGVRSDPVTAETMTDEDGLYSLRLTDPGIFTLRATAEGFATHYRPEVVVGIGDTKVNVGLTQGIEVVGYVLDESGRPVSEAGVALNAMMMGRGWNNAKEVTATDGMGRFGFRVEPDSARYMVRVVPGGGLDLMKMIEVPLKDELVLRLPGAGVITGRVVDADTRQPVADAEVLIALSEGGGRRMWMPDFSKALKTDAYGVYRITGVGEASLQSLSVRAEGFEQVIASGRMGTDPNLWKRLSALEITADGETQLPEIALDRGRLISGVVRDSRDKSPIPGATVELWDMVMGNRATLTGEDGSYNLSGVGDRVSMIVAAPGYATVRDMPFGGGFRLDEQEGDARRDFELESGATIESSVRTGTGQPVPGALVRLRADTSGRGRGGWFASMNLRDIWTFTNAKGEFRLTGVPPMKLQVEVEAQGFDVGRSDMRELKAGDTRKDMDVKLLPAATMEGRVVDRAGDPVPGARVTVARDPGPEADGRAQWRALAMGKTAFCGPNGRFTVAEVPVGDVLVRVEADGLATLSETRNGVEPGAKIRNVNLEMAPALSITGKVINAEGEPVTWAWVRARQTDSPDGEASSRMLGARLEADGSFRITNVAAGNYRIEVNVRNFMPNLPRYANLKMENVAAGTENLRLVLQVAEDDAR